MIAHEYQRLITEAKSTSLIDWDATGENRYVRRIGRLTVTVWLDRKDARWYWTLELERRGVAHQGESDSRELAKLEALAYAQHWVKVNHAEGVLN